MLNKSHRMFWMMTNIVAVFAAASFIVILAWLALVSIGKAAEKPPAAILILTIVTADGKPDIVHHVPKDSKKECFDEAKEFLDHGTPPSVEGAQGIMAACFVPKESEDSKT